MRIVCGRFTLTATLEKLKESFDIKNSIHLVPRYNIAPSQWVPVIRTPNTLELLHWGFLPGWLKIPKSKEYINARFETATDKPTFRQAFQKRRCLIIADGFYEWKVIGNRKQPYYVTLKHHKPFAMAGIWEKYPSLSGEMVEGCAILTLASPGFLHDRMPAILMPKDYDKWLKPNQLEPTDWQMMNYKVLEAYPVSTRVNDPKFDVPACIKIL